MQQRGERESRRGGRRLRGCLTAVVVLLAIVVLAIVGPALYVALVTSGARYDDPARIPPADTAIVFGAGLTPDGKPTPLLADRVHAAVQLYEAGTVKRLLLSGDGESIGHDEPAAMAAQAEAEGVPAAVITRDPGGVRT